MDDDELWEGILEFLFSEIMPADQGLETTSLVGTLREFSPDKDWKVAKSRMENFFIANGIKSEERKRALFLNALDDPAYKLITNLCIPTAPEEKEYKELIKVFDKHFLGGESVFASRYKFYFAMKEPTESVNDWIARLRSLAANCAFEGRLEANLLDRFVLGFNKGPIRDRLFEEDAKKVKWDAIVTIATSKEASTHCYDLTGAGPPTSPAVKKEPVNYVKSQNKNEKQGSSKHCTVCGATWHEAAKCRFKGYKCKICKVKGHLRSVCPDKAKEPKTPANHKGGKTEKTHFVREASDDDECLYNVMEGKDSEYRICLTLNSQEFCFDVDTGCYSTIVPKKLFEEKFPDTTPTPCTKTFTTYLQEKTSPVGCVTVDVGYRGKKVPNLVFYVVETEGPPLLGRSWFKALGFSIIADSSSQAIFYQKAEDGSQAESLGDELKRRYPEVFTEKLGKFKNGKIKLELLPDATPKFIKARPVPYAIRPKVDQEIDRLVKEGILEPIEYSDFGSPIVPVLKKNGQIRICGDYKLTLNPCLQTDPYPLPRIEDLFQKLGGNTVWAKADLSHAYQQCELDLESRKLVAITTQKGLFQYTRMPYGICVGPSKFQKLVDSVLAGIDGVVALLDDVVIGAPDEETLRKRVIEVFERFKKAGLTLSEKKCEFGKESIEYLGFRIDASGLHSTEEKIKSIVMAPNPKNVKDLQAFLGFVNYLARFLPSLSSTLHPLHQLLKKDVRWNWDDSCQKAFAEIKRIVQENRSLAHYNPDLPIRLTVDGSDYGLGAIISQVYPNGEEKPLAFASRTLTAAEKKYSQLHKEGAALVFGTKKFHLYLFGRKWTLANDNRPLLSIFGPKKGIPTCAANRLQRWALLLANYNYDVEWVQSSKNVADWLSRAPMPADPVEGEGLDPALFYVFEDNEDLPLRYEDVMAETKKEDVLKKVATYLRVGWPQSVSEELLPYFRRRDELHEEEGVILWGNRVIVPTRLRSAVLNELHSTHMGIVKVKSLARSYVWWPQIDSEIEETVKSCGACNAVKDNPPTVSLIPWEWPTKAWQRLHMDYLGPVAGQYYLVVVDSHSKWLEAFPTKSMTADVTIKILRQIFSRFGLPEVLVSDNYSAFESDEFQRFLKGNGITHKTGAPYHPATNGAAENSVRTVKRLLKTVLAESEHADLNKALHGFLLQYRNTPHATTNVSPAQALFGHSLRTRLDLLRPKPSTTASRVEKKQKQQIEQKGGKAPSSEKLAESCDVWAKNYRKGGEKWVKGTIVKCLGPRRRSVYVPEIDKTWTRHVEQLRPASQSSDFNSVDANQETEDSPDWPGWRTPTPSRRPSASGQRASQGAQQPRRSILSAEKDKTPTSAKSPGRPKRQKVAPRRLIEEM